MICEHLSRRRKLEPESSPPDPNWHMIGHLQRNKVRHLLPWVHTIHSLDSLRLAEEISTEAENVFRDAELTAIKDQYLSRTRALLAQAEYRLLVWCHH